MTENGSTKTAAVAERVEIAEPDLQRISVRIKGVTPLICSNGKQALDQLTKDRGGGPTTKKRTDPEKAFRSSLYEQADDGRYTFPSGGIARALKDAAIRFTDKKGTVVVGAIRLIGMRLPIEGSEPRMGADFVRHGGRTADIAYRAYFDEWEIDVPLIYNAEVISEANVVTLFSIAGFSVGIGAWRPEKNGTCGQFEVIGVSR